MRTRKTAPRRQGRDVWCDCTAWRQIQAPGKGHPSEQWALRPSWPPISTSPDTTSCLGFAPHPPKVLSIACTLGSCLAHSLSCLPFAPAPQASSRPGPRLQSGLGHCCRSAIAAGALLAREDSRDSVTLLGQPTGSYSRPQPWSKRPGSVNTTPGLGPERKEV